MNLFDEISLSGIKLKNRLVMAPMTTWSGNEDLTVSQEELEYYKERSQGVAMVITATTFFQKNGQGFPGQFFGGNYEYLDSLKSLADAIKSGGAKAILQIFHAGRMANPDDMKIVSASAVRPENVRFGNVNSRPVPRALEEEEILEIIDGFYRTTKIAIEAGFDGVEIHGANTYLIQQFFSPQSNKRTDKWGGSLEKRALFPKKVTESVLRAKNEMNRSDFIVGYRFSPEEIENPGITLSDTKFLIDNLCETNIDYLHISLADYSSSSIRDTDDKTPVGKILSQHVNGRKPFIGVGSVYTKNDAEQCLDLGFDIVALGRVIVADPYWVQKAEKSQEIEEYVDLKSAKKLKIPANMLNKIINTPVWFKVK